MKSAKSSHFTVNCLVFALIAPGVAAANLQMVQDDAPKKQAQRTGKYAEFEAKVVALRVWQQEMIEVVARVKGNPNASAEDIGRMQQMYAQTAQRVSDVSNYMNQTRFTNADRLEMQTIMDRILQAPPVDKSKGTGKDKPAS